MVKLVEIANQVLLLEWIFGLLVASVRLSEFLVQALPLFIVVLAVLLVLFHCILLLLVGIHAEGLFEGEGIDLLQNCLESNERLLQDLVPMLIC